MRFLNISYPKPEKNLALDEIILEDVEEGASKRYFSFVGKSCSFCGYWVGPTISSGSELLQLYPR